MQHWPQAAQQRDAITLLELDKRRLEIEAQKEAYDNIMHDIGQQGMFHSAFTYTIDICILPHCYNLLHRARDLYECVCQLQARSYGIESIRIEGS